MFMSGEFEQVSVSEIEALIRRLPTVLRCHVAVNEWGAVEEIHVLTTLDRAPKQIVRDVESALLAQWDLRIDHKKISVAQIVDDGPMEPFPRLIVAEFRMDLDTIHHVGHSFVRLQPSNDGSTDYEGQWRGHYVPSQYHNMMAWATVDALNQIPELREPLVLAALETMSLAGTTVVVVALSYVSSRRREEILVGAARERREGGHGAAVRAVLDAINRRLSEIQRPKPIKRPPSDIAETESESRRNTDQSES